MEMEESHLMGMEMRYLLVLLFVGCIWGQSIPMPIPDTKKIEILNVQIKTYQRIVSKLKAEVEFLKAERDISSLVSKLDKLEKDIRKETNADPSWRVDDLLNWEKEIPSAPKLPEAPK